VAKKKLLQILISNANIIKDKIKKLIKGDPAVKYKDDPEYQFLMRQLADIDMKLRDRSFEIFGASEDIDKQLKNVLKAKPKAKGGMVKRPQMVQGGAYKGKKHNYSAGGKVNELKNFKKRKV
jgi:hypothetical protein